MSSKFRYVNCAAVTCILVIGIVCNIANTEASLYEDVMYLEHGDEELYQVDPPIGSGWDSDQTSGDDVGTTSVSPQSYRKQGSSQQTTEDNIFFTVEASAFEDEGDTEKSNSTALYIGVVIGCLVLIVVLVVALAVVCVVLRKQRGDLKLQPSCHSCATRSSSGNSSITEGHFEKVRQLEEDGSSTGISASSNSGHHPHANMYGV